MIVGPTQLTFMYCELRGSPQRHISSPRIACRHGVASPPPYSRGQLCVSQPRSARRGQNSRAKAACASLPGPSLAISSQSAGRLSARKARSSTRKARSSSLHWKSTPPPPAASNRSQTRSKGQRSRGVVPSPRCAAPRRSGGQREESARHRSVAPAKSPACGEPWRLGVMRSWSKITVVAAATVSADAAARTSLGAGRDAITLRWDPASGPVAYYEVTCTVNGRPDFFVGTTAEPEIEIVLDSARWGETLGDCVVQAFDA